MPFSRSRGRSGRRASPPSVSHQSSLRAPLRVASTESLPVRTCVSKRMPLLSGRKTGYPMRCPGRRRRDRLRVGEGLRRARSSSQPQSGRGCRCVAPGGVDVGDELVVGRVRRVARRRRRPGGPASRRRRVVGTSSRRLVGDEVPERARRVAGRAVGDGRVGRRGIDRVAERVRSRRR